MSGRQTDGLAAVGSDVLLCVRRPGPTIADMPSTRAPSATTRALARRLDRGRLEVAISAARGLVERDTPFSPSWDAAMAALEDLQREYWLVRGRRSPRGGGRRRAAHGRGGPARPAPCA